MLVAHGRGLGDPGEGGPRGDAPSRCTRGHAGGRSPRRRRGGELLAPARGARLPDAVPRPRRDARMPASRARGPPRLLAGPLRRMEVRGLQPGPQLHAGCGARRPPARRWRRRRADAQPPGPCERGRVRRDGTPMISQAPAQVPDAITPRRERPRAWAALLAIVLFAAVLVFLLGRRLFGSAAGLVAALLVATCPFEAVFGSSMTVDIITSCLTAVTVLAFLKARDAAGARWFAYALLGAAATLSAYMVK